MKEFVQSSFEELFTSRRYGLVFYFVGTVLLGTIAALVQSNTGNYSLSIFLILVLFIPLHFLTYAVKQFPAWLVGRIVTSNVMLHKQMFENQEATSQRDMQHEALIIELVILESVMVLVSLLTIVGAVVLTVFLTNKPLLIASVLIFILLAALWTVRSLRQRLLNVIPESLIAPYRRTAQAVWLHQKGA
jgi:hypothetical protein